MDAKERVAGAEVIAEIRGQQIELSSVSVKQLTIRLDDRLLDLDQEVKVIGPDGTVLSNQKPTRTLGTLAKTFDERHDPELAFPAEVTVELP